MAMKKETEAKKKKKTAKEKAPPSYAIAWFLIDSSIDFIVRGFFIISERLGKISSSIISLILTLKPAPVRASIKSFPLIFNCSHNCRKVVPS